MQFLRNSLIVMLVLTISHAHIFGSGDLVKYFANSYSVTNPQEVKFLELVEKTKIKNSKEAAAFVQKYQTIINNTSKKALEAAYWLANKQGKLDLANQFLPMID